MGAGVSTSSNTATALASAYTNVIDSTSVMDDQKTKQTQSVTLENCDITAWENVNINMSSRMTQSMHQIANVTNNTTISNDIAQALTQAATSSVGAGVIGIADANNTASVYANMTNNIGNYVKFSAKQAETANQSFDCQNSTIVAEKGSFNLSMMEVGDVSQYTDDTVMNENKVNNTITQTISQTASASTGLDLQALLVVAVVLIVGGIIFKLKDAKSNATRAIDMEQAVELGCCTNAQLDININANSNTNSTSSIRGGNPNSNEPACAGCDCYKLAHPEAHISKATLVVYTIGLVVFGGLIAAWYLIAETRGCLFSGACSSNNSGTSFLGIPMGGCSCDFNLENDGSRICKDSLHASFGGNGLPIKYQYPLFIQNQVNSKCTDVSAGPASLQGILVSALNPSTISENSNNGKNMQIIMTYMCLFGGSPPETTYFDNGNACAKSQNMSSLLVNIYVAAVHYITANSTNPNYQMLANAMGTGDEQAQAARLYAFLCPLRPRMFQLTNSVMADLPGTWPATSDSTQSGDTPSNNLQWVDASASSYTASNTYLLEIPQAFRYGTGAGSAADPDYNRDAGCCSLHSMIYAPATPPQSVTPLKYSCGCGDDPSAGKAGDGSQAAAMAFCTGGSGKCQSQGDSKTCSNSGKSCTSDDSCIQNTSVDPDTQETMMSLPDYSNPGCSDSSYQPYVSLAAPSSHDTTFQDPPSSNVADVSNMMAYYADWTDFEPAIDSTNVDVMSLIRLLWTATYARITGSNLDTIYGLNAMLDAGSETTIVDHFYVAKTSSSTDLNPVGVISDSNDSTGIIHDETLLTIKLTSGSSYDVEKGMHQATCGGSESVIDGQGYTASAPKLGYCRSNFFNRFTLYSIVGVAILWALSLPVFIIARWYINRGTRARYLNAATTQSNSKRKSSRIAQSISPTKSAIEMTSMTKPGSPSRPAPSSPSRPAPSSPSRPAPSRLTTTSPTRNLRPDESDPLAGGQSKRQKTSVRSIRW